MAKIYKNTKLDLYVNTGIDLSTTSNRIIKAKKPSGTIVSLNASLQSDNTTLKHEFRNTDLSEDGRWTFWAYVTASGGSPQIGEPTQLQVFKEGQ